MARAMALETTYEEWAAAALAAVDAVFAEQDTLTADDLHGRVEEPDHPNWWGALFKTQEFKQTARWCGECKNSTRKGRAGSMIRVWRRRQLTER